MSSGDVRHDIGTVMGKEVVPTGLERKVNKKSYLDELVALGEI